MKGRSGFTLVELVVVILILGILTAVAVPKLVGATSSANESTLLQSLSVVRDAIDMYAARNSGALPGEAGTEADFKADLAPYMRVFPKNPLKSSAVTDIQTTGAAITTTLNGGIGWRYDNKSGQFIANSNGMSSDGVRRYYEL